MPTDPISITHISLAKNPAPFLAPIAFDFTFQAHHALTAPLEWRILYLGSASDEAYDQVLEEFETHAVEAGTPMRCSVECPPPDWKKIPRRELLSKPASI
jgi:histone chaperone ASF1